MTKAHKQRRNPFVPYSQADWEEVSDNPELTDEELANVQPVHAVLPPDVLAALTSRARGRPRAEKPKVEVKIRLDPDIVELFKSGGPGWQTRINNALRMHLAVRVEPIRSAQIRPSRDETNLITVH